MPCPSRYFIILYNSMFVTVTLKPRKNFSLKLKGRGGGRSVSLF